MAARSLSATLFAGLGRQTNAVRKRWQLAAGATIGVGDRSLDGGLDPRGSSEVPVVVLVGSDGGVHSDDQVLSLIHI